MLTHLPCKLGCPSASRAGFGSAGRALAAGAGARPNLAKSSVRLISRPSGRTKEFNIHTFSSRRAGAPLILTLSPGVNVVAVQPSLPRAVRAGNSQRQAAGLPSEPVTVKYTYPCGFTNSNFVTVASSVTVCARSKCGAAE
jgi:hypothetical protein